MPSIRYKNVRKSDTKAINKINEQLTEINNDSNMEITPIDHLKVDHLENLLTDIGVWQHAIGNIPHIEHGYSIDDVARALIVALQYNKLGMHNELCSRMAEICLGFIDEAAKKSGDKIGRYHNFRDYKGNWLDNIGSDDSFGRTLWALGITVGSNSPYASAAVASELFNRSLPICDTLQYLRSIAFSILGIHAAGTDKEKIKQLADKLAASYRIHSSDNWRWYEPMMTYCNARLPQAMFTASANFPNNNEYLNIATESLDFLLRIMHNEKGNYSPIGNAPLTKSGWFNKWDTCPPLFDQQPVDAGALVECCVNAYLVTAEPRYRQAAYDAYGWYFGENVHGLMLYDLSSGGVSDALTRRGINRNMGAESVVSLHLAHIALRTI